MNKVICPIEHVSISEQECLECALTWNNQCQFDYGLLKAMFEQPDRSGIHVTDLTSCLRKAYYSKTNPRPAPVHSLLNMFTGTAIHGAVERNCDNTAECELALEADGIVGKTDRFYNDGTLVDYKTTRGLKPSRLPYSNHRLQLQIYAHMLRKMGNIVNRAFIQYIDLAGPTKCINGPPWARCNAIVDFRDGKYICPKCGREFLDGHLGAWRAEVNIDGNIEYRIKNARDMLLGAIETGNPPLPKSSVLCGFCQFADLCGQEKKPERNI